MWRTPFLLSLSNVNGLGSFVGLMTTRYVEIIGTRRLYTLWPIGTRRRWWPMAWRFGWWRWIAIQGLYHVLGRMTARMLARRRQVLIEGLIVLWWWWQHVGCWRWWGWHWTLYGWWIHLARVKWVWKNTIKKINKIYKNNRFIKFINIKTN